MLLVILHGVDHGQLSSHVAVTSLLLHYLIGKIPTHIHVGWGHAHTGIRGHVAARSARVGIVGLGEDGGKVVGAAEGICVVGEEHLGGVELGLLLLEGGEELGVVLAVELAPVAGLAEGEVQVLAVDAHPVTHALRQGLLQVAVH